jgi:NAD(P)-dependent dehydrogenase (short-subunit alcohol dehydrogenase family)
VALLKSGWSVVLAGRREEHLAATAALGEGAPCLVQPTDVADPDSVDALFAAAKAASAASTCCSTTPGPAPRPARSRTTPSSTGGAWST